MLSEIKSTKGGDRGGGRPAINGKPKEGRPPIGLSRSQAARGAGLSADQQKQAQRVARVPELDFERAVESESPPTVTELADRGTRKQPTPLIDLAGRDPKDFAACTAAMGRIRDLEALA